jgi:hypothetical protein
MCHKPKNNSPPSDERPWKSTITLQEWLEVGSELNVALNTGVLRITEWNPPNYWAALYKPSVYGYAADQQQAGG